MFPHLFAACQLFAQRAAFGLAFVGVFWRRVRFICPLLIVRQTLGVYGSRSLGLNSYRMNSVGVEALLYNASEA